MSEAQFAPAATVRAPSVQHGKVLFIETTDFCVESHLSGQLAHLSRHGLEPVVATRDTGILTRILEENDVSGNHLAIARDPSPVRDIRGFFATLRRIHREKPDMVVYGTPKAALFGAIAAAILRVPRRVFFLYGLRAETMTGLPRALMVTSERLVVALSTDSLAVGAGVREKAREIGISTTHMRLAGRGSANGVDVEHFAKAGADSDLRRSIRSSWGIGSSSTVIGFVGRITADKGIESLIAAGASLRATGHDVHVVLVGPDEGISRLDADTRGHLTAPWVSMPGQIADTAMVYSAFDIFCLPSRREGLATVVLEACAAAVPVVVTDATGMRDALDDGRVGTIVPIDDTAALSSALAAIVIDPTEARRLAGAAQQFVRREFATDVVWEHLRLFYTTLLGDD